MGIIEQDTHRPFVIAVGVDFSESARPALFLARSLAHGHPDVVVHAVHVTSLPGVTEHTHIDVNTELDKVRHACAPVSHDLADHMRCHVVVGRVDRELVRFASDCGADLLIIGARDRGALDRFVTGSNSSKIMRAAPCSVLVARPSERMEEEEASASSRLPINRSEGKSSEERYGDHGLSHQVDQR
ncbi:MAG: universal stress protein, partial [Polyangiaceae bacterium]